MKLLPGFRDFYPEDCARRNYILTKWREVARRYGFVEYDGPVLEPMSLFEKKSGGELVGQLFDFTDKGERHVTLRPEMTPTLARMVAARERDFKKPLKWFCVPQFFRYEKQQRGRLREFYQLNADIIGEASAAADAELLALVIDVLRSFGFGPTDFVIRLSNRDVWTLGFLNKKMPGGYGGVAVENEFFQILDKIERQPREQTDALFARFTEAHGMEAISLSELEMFMSESAEKIKTGRFASDFSEESLRRLHKLINEDLAPRGLADFVELDFTIVRGLAYYAGAVFEVFDRSLAQRALAGGGRYDHLISNLTDGRVGLPALGFGMGDVVLANLIDDTPAAKAQMDAWLAQNRATDLFVVIAKEARRPDALALVQQLREAGHRVDFPLTETKIGKQFQTAEQLGAARAILVGDEWPQVKVKTLATREETLVPAADVLSHLSGSHGPGALS